MNKTTISSGNRFDLKELVRIIGYKLTAYIGRASISDVRSWLGHGLPQHLEERMQAAFDVAKPIEDAEFELIAQYFLMQKIAGIEPYQSPAMMLRDAADITTARAVLMEIVRKEFLLNVADNLEDVEHRLQQWIASARMPPRTRYKTGISPWNRLWLKLLHAGYSLEQQRKWDRGEDWPLWADLIAAVPEMATSRTTPNLQTGCPYRYLRSSSK